MKKYEYGRINILNEKLQEFNVKSDICKEIMKKGEQIKKTTSPKEKAEWMKNAMKQMDNLLDSTLRYSIRAACACCLGGKRHKIAKEIFKNNNSLEERIKKANDTKFLFGHSVTMLENKDIVVSFQPDDWDSYKCVCLPKAEGAISITYCYCCGGHVKHHLQTVLGKELKLKVKSSALSSKGKKPCTFQFKIIEKKSKKAISKK